MLTDKDTNIVYIADTLRTLRTDVYNRLTKLLSDIGIEVCLLYGTKDIWCRDYMPVQVDKSLFVKYHYAPDYMWSITKYNNDITDCSDICKSLGIKYKETDLIMMPYNLSWIKRLEDQKIYCSLSSIINY